MTNAAIQPTPFGRAWIRSVFAETDGRATGGLLISSKAGRGKPAIVVIPGSFRPAEMLQPAARLLCDDYDILIVDMPGFGASPIYEPASIASFAGRAFDLMQAVLGERETILLGESIGGIVAMALAHNLAGRLRAAVYLDPPVSATALAAARNYLRRGTAGVAMDDFFTGYVDGPGMFGDGGAQGYWPLVATAAAHAPTLIMSGGRTTWVGAASPGALFTQDDEAAALAMQIETLAVQRIPTAGHLLYQENPGECATATVRFLRAALSNLHHLARQLVDAPDDASSRDALLATLNGFDQASLLSQRDALLAVVRARPDDVQLMNAILRTVYKLLDTAGFATMRYVAAHAAEENTKLWTCLHTAVSLSCLGDPDGALDTLRAFSFGADMPTRVAGLILTIELYSEHATDLSVARAKETQLAVLRRHLPKPLMRPSVRRASAVPRIGMASGSFGMRNYMSLLLPFLREAAKLPLSIELLPLVAGDLEIVRNVLPTETPIRDVEEITIANVDRPEAWHRMNQTLADLDYDLLIDLDESLVAYLPACVVGRPGAKQATWFNMSGPSHDPCFDAAIGPESIYPRSLDAAFPGKIARLPGDLYVFEPEIWAEHGLALPDAGPPPSGHNGYVTFGSLSHLYKITQPCIALWAKVLHALPEARLYLGNGDLLEMHVVDRVRNSFRQCGVAPERLIFAYHFGWPRYLAGYQNIDVVLGTFPVAGGTTLFEAAHMGMPILSRVAATSLGRIGRWLEAATGRAGIAHDSDESFVAEAVRLAHATDERAALRANETKRLAAKSKRDAARMAAAFFDIVQTRFLRS
jgi:pimeloyl-ACP methyl ester carboxylesterase